MLDDSTDSECIVCFKNVKYFSVGECDHPVCFECSTRMRVLYQQKECPICRQQMPLVIFTGSIQPFKEINHNDFNLDDSAKISFESAEIMKAYYDLQTIKCPKCPLPNQPSFLDFKALQTHVKDEHNLMYCDLCVKYLKIFPFERRCYSRSELSTHNKQGDKNDRSHKGHALCQFCNKRFFDTDILYRHLRKDHLFCHFCDAEGHNKFYSSYDYLREHFQSKHYLCEEGECRTEQFTNVFKTDLDLKAHRLNTHGKNLGKQAYREARIVDLQLNFKPRSQSDSRNSSAHHSSRSHDVGAPSCASGGRARERERELVCADYSEFPSLVGSSSSTAPPVFARKFQDKTFGRNNFSMVKENFPALGTDANVKAVSATSFINPPRLDERQKTCLEAVSSSGSGPVRSSLSVDNGHSSNENAVLKQWGSSRKNEPAQPVIEKPKIPKKNQAEDFPSLAHASSNAAFKQKKPSKPASNENEVAQPSYQINKVKVKKKNDIDNNTDKSKSDKSKKKQNGNETKLGDGARKSTKISKEHQVSSENNKNSVNRSSSSRNNVNNVNSNINGTKSAVSNIKNNHSTSDISTGNKSSKSAVNSNNNNNNNNNHSGGKKNKNVILNDNNFPALTNSHADNNHSNENQSSKKQKQKSCNSLMETKKNSVPPGFEGQMGTTNTNATVKPPPGFTVLSSISSPSPFFNQNFSYTYPPNFEERNLALERTCRNIFDRNKKSFNDFKQESELFISGILSAESYLQSISSLLGADQLHTVFPELIVLLPNIQKQQELFAAYENLAIKSAKKLKNNKCSVCGQVLSTSDKGAHSSAHNLRSNFPPLGMSRK